MWKIGAYESPLTAFHCRYNGSPDGNKATCNGYDGIQKFGGINQDLIKNQRIWWYKNEVFPDVNKVDFVYDPPIYNYWGIQVQTLRLGDEYQKLEGTSQKSPPAAISDHASYGCGLPLSENACARLIEMAGAIGPIELEEPPNNGDQSFYSFNCTKVDELPEIGYRFKGHRKEWVAQPNHYVEELSNGTCTINVCTLAKGNEFMGNFGETFSKDKYVVFDFENIMIGLAEIDW